MIITLIGFRGSGKSSVAHMLGAQLGWRAIDADLEIERQAGCSIAEIFQRHGEQAFRQLEREVLLELLQADRVVLAAGGGAVLHDVLRQRFRQAGPVIWLQVSAEAVIQRLAHDPRTMSQRPRLTSEAWDEEIKQLLQQRAPLYDDASTFRVDTTQRSVPEVVTEILQFLIDSQLIDPCALISAYPSTQQETETELSKGSAESNAPLGDNPPAPPGNT